MPNSPLHPASCTIHPSIHPPHLPIHPSIYHSSTNPSTPSIHRHARPCINLIIILFVTHARCANFHQRHIFQSHFQDTYRLCAKSDHNNGLLSSIVSECLCCEMYEMCADSLCQRSGPVSSVVDQGCANSAQYNNNW